MRGCKIRSGLILICLAAWLCVAPAVTAGFLDGLFGRNRDTTQPAPNSPSAIDAAAAHIKSLRPKPGQIPIAAAASQEGHWRLVNRAGETMTAASPDEMARALNVLTPELATHAGNRLAVYLSEESVFRHPAALKDLPPADLNVVVGNAAFAVLTQGAVASLRVFAALRPRLIIELVNRRAFDEAIAQLSQTLDKAAIRIISLQPGGAGTLAGSPQRDPATRRALADSIDPDRFRHALPSLRGQTALVTGRVEGDLLLFKPASGPERSLLLRDITAAAEASDVNLIVLKSSARQPGARNWLWQRVEVENLDQAIERTELADFLNALAGDSGRMTVTATQAGPDRTLLEIERARGLAGEPSENPLTSIFSDILSEVTAKVVIQGIRADMRSSNRDRELARRIVPGIPALLQYGYGAALLLGLSGFATARRWWGRIWPPESPREYGSAFGYQAARVARDIIFGVLFLPLAGPAACLRTIVGPLLGRVTSRAQRTP